MADDGLNEILRLMPGGRFALTLVAGTRRGSAGIWGVGHPATNASPDGRAFDRAGDLFIAGGNTKTLLMITTRGVISRCVS